MPERKNYISLTAWATPYSLSERRKDDLEPTGEIHVVVLHGKGTRTFTIDVSLDDCLALCANAADAARLLLQEKAR